MTVNNLIKGIILDVDGVIVGGKKGFNWPAPHPDVIQALKSLRAKGISKKQAAEIISKTTQIPFEYMLGVGDSLTDWDFIQLCNYGGVMGNASNDLKEIIKSKPNGHFVIGKSVDENGLLDIFKYYCLI